MLSKRIAVIKTNDCVACGTCENICPKSAVRIHKGCYAKADDAFCVGCGKCAKACPMCCIELKEREMAEV